MADILLIQPIVGLLDEVKDKPAIPLSLITASTNLVGDYSVKLIDQRIEVNWREQLLEELGKKPICVGVTCMLGPQVKHTLEILKVVKDNSTIPTVWGGSMAGMMPDKIIEHPNVDYVIQGDGEVSFRMLIDSLVAGHTGKRLSDIPGLYGKDVKGIEWQLIDLNEQPDPPYHIVDIERYLPSRYGYPAIDVETSRGCIYRCEFCYNPFLHKGTWRKLDSKRVSERVRELVKAYSIKGVWFVDDEFFIDLGRSLDIIQAMRNLDLTWSIQGATITSASKMSVEYLRELVNSGCKQMNLGVESGSKRVLKYIRKPLNTELVYEVNSRFRRAGISPWYYFVVGFPTETGEELSETLSLIGNLIENNPDARISGIGCYTPYPNTRLYYQSEKFGYIPPKKLRDWSTYGVDNINVPWLKDGVRRDVIGAQFTSFFIDRKIEDLKVNAIIKLIATLYKPIARWRFKSKFFKFPLDIMLGNIIKKRIGK